MERSKPPQQTEIQLRGLEGFLIQVMLCQSDLILLHKWGLDDSQSHTTVFIILGLKIIRKLHTLRTSFRSPWILKMISLQKANF